MIEIQLPQKLSLRIGGPGDGKAFPTHRMQKGLRLLDGDQELTEEGVGFGVPVVKRGLTAYFPGEVELAATNDGSLVEIKAKYSLNLVERLVQNGNGTVENRVLYAVKDLLAAVIRKVPLLRSILTSASSQLRSAFGLETTYLNSAKTFEIPIVYRLDTTRNQLSVDVDTSRLPPEITEVIIMNEQGAGAFDSYGDSSETTLVHDEILCWDEITASCAWFESSRHRIAFRLDQIPQAKLYRGRELIGTRLAWAGFGYSFHPSVRTICYEIQIERTE